ncbi:MAG: hypothetical protein WCO86_16375, partial [Planctomycetota bacterium]
MPHLSSWLVLKRLSGAGFRRLLPYDKIPEIAGVPEGCSPDPFHRLETLRRVFYQEGNQYVIARELNALNRAR